MSLNRVLFTHNISNKWPNVSGHYKSPFDIDLCTEGPHLCLTVSKGGQGRQLGFIQVISSPVLSNGRTRSVVHRATIPGLTTDPPFSLSLIGLKQMPKSDYTQCEVSTFPLDGHPCIHWPQFHSSFVPLETY